MIINVKIFEAGGIWHIFYMVSPPIFSLLPGLYLQDKTGTTFFWLLLQNII